MEEPLDQNVEQSDTFAAGARLTYGQWRILAIVAAVTALLWPTISFGVEALGGPHLLFGSFTQAPFPNTWLVAFALGYLIARTESVHLATIGALISTGVAVAAFESPDNLGPQWGFASYTSEAAGGEPQLIDLIEAYTLPWLWIAVMIGLGALVAIRWGDRIRLGD